MIRLSQLKIRGNAGLTLLDLAGLEIAERSVLGVYGPNGSGKSSLLRAMSGRQDSLNVSGEIVLGGTPIELLGSPRERVKRVLYLGSDFRSPFQITVRELLELGLESASGRFRPGLIPSERDRVASVMEALDLVRFLPRIFQTLSDGEKQMVMFARALAQAPKILVLDETFSKLDLDRLISVTRIIRSWTECGMTFVICSHDLNFLSEVSDQLLFLKGGRPLALGAVDSVLTEANLGELFSKLIPHVVTSPESGKRKILY